MRLITGKPEKRSSKRGRDCNGHHPELRHCLNNLLLPYCIPFLLPFVPEVPFLTPTRPDGRCFFPVVPNCPFLLSVSPVASASLPSESSFCSAKVVGLRKCQVTAISLCFIKNNDAGCACPTFLMSKTCRVTYNPNLIEAEKRLRTQMGNESQ